MKKTWTMTAVLACLAAPWVQAQTSQAAIQTLEKTSSGQANRQGATPETIIVPRLAGLIFLSRPQDLNKDGVNRTGVDTHAVPMLDTSDFRDRLTPRLGNSLTFAGLDIITHSVIEYYRQHNHPLVDAVAPVQNVQSGVIQIVVSEYRVGEVRVEGNRWFSSKLIAAGLKLQHGDTINGERIVSQLDAANSNPFRQVNLVYQPSKESGYTDVVLQTIDRLPVQVFAGFDNSGTPVTTRDRWNMGVTWGNALWRDQQISYQLSTSDDFFTGRDAMLGQPRGASFVGQTLAWKIPVRASDFVSVSGGYFRSVPNVGDYFGLVGKSGQAGLHYSFGLPRSEAVTESLQIGYDFKTTNNNLQFGGTVVSANSVEIDEFPLAYNLNYTDRWGNLSVTTTAVLSPGRWTPENNNTAFQPAAGQSGREYANARYIYWRTDLDRITKLPYKAAWATHVSTQLSSTNLLYTEQLAGGGPDILRGYDPNSILGDQGVILSNELRSPPWRRKLGEIASGQGQVLGFWDFGHLTSVHDVVGGINHLNASSAGFGIRYNLCNHLSANMDFGWQLQHLPGFGDRNHLLSFSLVTSY